MESRAVALVERLEPDERPPSVTGGGRTAARSGPSAAGRDPWRPSLRGPGLSSGGPSRAAASRPRNPSPGGVRVRLRAPRPALPRRAVRAPARRRHPHRRPSPRRPLARRHGSRARRPGSRSSIAGRPSSAPSTTRRWTPGERIDRDLILGELDHARFNDEVLREETWNPLVWVYLLGGGIHPLLSREFAPLDDRLASVAGRLEGVPAVLDARPRRRSGAHPERPVAGSWPRPPRNGSAGSRARRRGGRGRRGGRRGRRRRRRGAPAPAPGGAAPRRRRWTSSARHLAEDVAPAATGQPDPRPGAVRGQAAAHPPRPGRDAAAILERAERDFGAVRAEMVRIAREIWSDWVPGEPAPTTMASSSVGVLDEISNEHPAADELVAGARRAGAGRGVLPRARRHRPRRRAARHRLDAGVPALVRRRDAGLAGAARPRPEVVLLDHAGPRRLAGRPAALVPAGDEHPPDAAARHPRGGARPLPPGRVRQPRLVARPPRVRLGRVRGGLGRVRDAGHARPRVLRGRHGAVAQPLEVLPAARSRTRSSTSGCTPPA